MTTAISSALRLWLGSFLLVAVVALCFFGAPLVPILLAGALTFVWSVARYAADRRQARR